MPFDIIVDETKVCVRCEQFGCSMAFGYGFDEVKVCL